MPKVRGSLADVQTEYVLIEPDTYEMKIDKINVTEKKPDKDLPSGQLQYEIVSKVDQPDSEHHNKPVRDNIFWFKKDGNVNEFAQAQLKRYFIAVVGEDRANEDDLDTDELLGGRFLATVFIESYKRKDDSEGQSNRLKNISPIE